jgi:hypothetical protein
MMPGPYASTQGFTISAYGQQVNGSAVQITEYNNNPTAIAVQA